MFQVKKQDSGTTVGKNPRDLSTSDENKFLSYQYHQQGQK